VRRNGGERATVLAYAVLSAVTAILAELVARLVWGLPGLPEQAIARVVQILPVGFFAWGIQTLGGAAKPLLFLGLMMQEASVLALLGLLWLRLKSRSERVLLLLVIFGVYLASMLIVMPLLGLGVFGVRSPGGWQQAAPGPLLTYGAWGVGLLVARGLSRMHAARTQASRRRVVLVGGFWSVMAVFGLGAGGRQFLRRTTITVVGGTSGRTPALTSTEAFYVVSKNVLDPIVDAQTWRLRVGGAVERPLQLTLEDLRALPSQEQVATMECISNPVGGNLISTGTWTGVPLAALLERAGVRPGAFDVVSRCADGYTESIEIAHARSPEVLVVYALNNEPLTRKHGAPVRLQTPGRYGIKSAKWLERLDVVPEDYLGYWQKEANWTDAGLVHTECRIDRPPGDRVPREGALITGIAYTGLSRVSRVEVSTDDGQTWTTARLAPELGSLAWRLWTYPWRPSAPGQYRLVARAYDGGGEPQAVSKNVPRGNPAVTEGVLIDGAVGLHSLRVTVDEMAVP